MQGQKEEKEKVDSIGLMNKGELLKWREKRGREKDGK